jgi:hypothetical protein
MHIWPYTYKKIDLRPQARRENKKFSKHSIIQNAYI